MGEVFNVFNGGFDGCGMFLLVIGIGFVLFCIISALFGRADGDRPDN